ncbi:hypothetical protein GWO43_11540 [candidate division KSB1 bacterium]|nr:hypothetical protein [candidate division KSB1 bacterium]NIR72012.1 hypothetical protein [candidate division KSB1 bacterium]NIS24591.1 hypothetical protein [candidate division KSB1 bacterium]NIT71499.1 hypothetical protein [candidate division KSB1 bacterium]NIU24144.1 hypothetical protein [candidate division KSB1 bacterium]
MGRIAEELAEQIILTSDNPRSESPRKILNDIDRGIGDKSKRKFVPDRKFAILEALKLAREGDVVLITGKGHETYQEIDGQRHPFEDRLVAKEQLEQL